MPAVVVAKKLTKIVAKNHTKQNRILVRRYYSEQNMSQDFDQFLLETEHNEEIPKVCPLCSSPISFYFINIYEKFLMCENALCPFPFGCERLRFIRVKDEPEMEYSVKSPSSETTNSNITNITVSEEDTLSATSPLFMTANEIRNEDEKQKNLYKSLDEIKKLQEKFRSLDTDEVQTREQRVLKSTKYINKLRSLQEISGAKLLRPEEMDFSKKTEPNFGLGELKIDVDAGNGNGPKINVQIQNHNPENLTESQPDVSICEGEPIELIVIQDERPDRFIEPDANVS